MGRIIIGIHGLGNKPPKETLEKWWEASINEGFSRYGRPGRRYRFKLVYWADCLYDTPLDPSTRNEKSGLYIDSPYIPSSGMPQEAQTNGLRKKILHNLEAGMEKLFLSEDLTSRFSLINDFIVHYFFRDYKKYYDADWRHSAEQPKKARDVIDARLAEVLWENRRKKILMISHSMGSIIAYHVLTEVVPEVPIDTFVTIGSPLGLPAVKSKIASCRKDKEHEISCLRTPENIVKNWYNLADLKDTIAMDYCLSDDFETNSRKVRVIDKIVSNDYEYNRIKNYHKVYGYLRTPELIEIIDIFLGKTRRNPIAWIKKVFGTGLSEKSLF